MISTKKSLVIGLVLLIGMAFILPTHTMAAGKPEFVWKVQSSWPAGSGLHYLQMRTLDFIENWTRGRVAFERYSADEIVPGYETWNAVQRGVIPAGMACTCYTMSKDWLSGMMCSAPGLGPVEKMAFYHGTKDVRDSKNYETPVWKFFEKRMREKFNVQVLPSAMQTTETFLYSTKPINTIEDLKKLKIRSVGVRGDVFKAAGCSVVGMPAGEIMPAMERGVIDAAEFANFFGDVPLGFADAAKYIYFNPYSSAPSNLMLFVNADQWDKIPKDLQKLIKEAAFESMKWSLSECLYLDFLTMRKAEKDHGAKIQSIPMEVGQYVHEKAMEFYKEKAKEDQDLAQYMKYYDEFFVEQGNGEYIKYIDDLL
ncbi:MAG: TRAP transporter substrate-binding protein DctP [Deltaproteobacteria bacterium]|uniref:TRAP transporter substrate-binding protein DctP n=1 Tax=Desulfobacula sp. TaxID=2593537 RepID=UPI0019A1D54C|nr:TRAP transporter substrate-binding protein DctP [Candidatus Desulfobacula maris]MBL6992981.1 TRAP transporter substrate-binding protein DctP [Desulfobacula sp.]